MISSPALADGAPSTRPDRHKPAIEFRHLRYFLAVAEEGSFNQAAARLLISQPSLSRQIKTLERHLGELLFERTSRGAQLTAAGAALLGHTRQLLALQAATRDVVSAFATREMVSIGIPPGTPSTRMVRIVKAIKRGVPQCALSCVEASSTEQLQMLRQGRLDIGIVHQTPPTEHLSRCLWDEPLGVAVHPRHPLAARQTYRLADLDALRVLVHSRNQVPTQQDSLMSAASAADLRPVWLFTQFIEHARACAEAADADAVLVGAHTASQQLPDWPWRPLAELPLAMTTWMVWPADTRTIVREVADAIIEQMAQRPG